MQQKRIGVYGGGFDPIHNAHLNIAQAVTTHLNLDKLIWVPTGVAWHKPQALSAAKHRVAMLELAFEQVPLSIREKWCISTFETDRQEDSYTIDTLTYLQSEHVVSSSEWYLIIGTDQLNALHRWRNWQEITERAKLAVVERKEIEQQVDSAIQQATGWVEIPFEETSISSSQIRDLVKKGVEHNGALQREAIKNELASLLPKNILNYIIKNKLYQ